MTIAQCACGALRLKLSEPPRLTALCHCFACQRRTGAPFSANAFYAPECVEISGASTEFMRTADSGRKVRMHFAQRADRPSIGRPKPHRPGSGWRLAQLRIRPSRRLSYRCSSSRSMLGCGLAKRSNISKAFQPAKVNMNSGAGGSRIFQREVRAGNIRFYATA